MTSVSKRKYNQYTYTNKFEVKYYLYSDILMTEEGKKLRLYYFSRQLPWNVDLHIRFAGNLPRAERDLPIGYSVKENGKGVPSLLFFGKKQLIGGPQG